MRHAADVNHPCQPLTSAIPTVSIKSTVISITAAGG